MLSFQFHVFYQWQLIVKLINLFCFFFLPFDTRLAWLVVCVYTETYWELNKIQFHFVFSLSIFCIFMLSARVVDKWRVRIFLPWELSAHTHTPRRSFWHHPLKKKTSCCNLVYSFTYLSIGCSIRCGIVSVVWLCWRWTSSSCDWEIFSFPLDVSDKMTSAVGCAMTTHAEHFLVYLMLPVWRPPSSTNAWWRRVIIVGWFIHFPSALSDFFCPFPISHIQFTWPSAISIVRLCSARLELWEIGNLKRANAKNEVMGTVISP